MKDTLTNPEVRESTYALLVRSEEKERNLFETVIYSLFVLSVVAAVWQFANQPVNVPEKIGTADTNLGTVETTDYPGI